MLSENQTIVLTSDQFETLMNGARGKKVTKSIRKTMGNAMNLTDWMCAGYEFIPISKMIGMKSLSKYYARTILLNLNRFNDNERPIICSNKRKKIFHYKLNDEWHKNDNFIHKLISYMSKDVAYQLRENNPDDDDDDEMDETTEYKSGGVIERQHIFYLWCVKYDTLVADTLRDLAELLKNDTEIHYID